MILEGLITTVDDDGRPHLSAIGPEVDAAITRIELRPFQSSQTYQNLQRTHQAVFHVTDDVESIADAVCGKRLPDDLFERATNVDGFVLTTACRAFEVEVSYHNDDNPRATLPCRILHVHILREFFGFNRAKHAVVEAAILATRTALIPQAEIEAQWKCLCTLVEKTGGDPERRAFAQLTASVEKAFHTSAT